MIKKEQLPCKGKIRYVPPKGFKASEALPNAKFGKKKAFIDRFDNVWVEGPSRTKGQNFEWDVQLSNKGRQQLGWASRDKKHLNVSLDGRVTHK